MIQVQIKPASSEPWRNLLAWVIWSDAEELLLWAFECLHFVLVFKINCILSDSNQGLQQSIISLSHSVWC